MGPLSETKVEPRSLEFLFGLLQEAKAMEVLAKDERLAIESEIIRHVEDPPTSGSLTLKGGAMRCSVKYGLTYKVDVAAIRELDGEVAEMLPLKKTPAKWGLDEKAYESLRETRPDLFSLVAAHVTTKPKKVSLGLKI